MSKQYATYPPHRLPAMFEQMEHCPTHWEMRGTGHTKMPYCRVYAV